VRLGFTRAIVPAAVGRRQEPPTVDGLEVVAVSTVRDAIAAALAERPAPRGDALSAMLG